MALDPVVDYLEKTFADSYRKEIDQEENIWRSLPFFAATLALQLAGLGQIRDWLALLSGYAFIFATFLLLFAGLATGVALACLAFSVWPADFRRVADEVRLRNYAEAVRRQTLENSPDRTYGEAANEAALVAVKAVLVEHYALATKNNRGKNEKRVKWRVLAGLATLASVFSILALVALTVVSTLYGK